MPPRTAEIVIVDHPDEAHGGEERLAKCHIRRLVNVDDIGRNPIEDDLKGICGSSALTVGQFQTRETTVKQRLIGRRAAIGGRGVSEETLMSSSAEPFNGISNILFDATEEPTFFVDEENSHR